MLYPPKMEFEACGEQAELFLPSEDKLHSQGPRPGFPSWSSHWLAPPDRAFSSHWIPSAPLRGPLVSHERSCICCLSIGPGNLKKMVYFSPNFTASSLITEVCSSNTSHDVSTQQALNKCAWRFLFRKKTFTSYTSATGKVAGEAKSMPKNK